MLGLMQRYPLLISSLIVHAARHRGGTEVVSNLGGPTLHRSTYAEVELRSRRLARALGKLGVGLGDRVATLAWNDFRHLELYYGVSATQNGRSGRCCSSCRAPECESTKANCSQ
jgi:3-(methylthio)propionyl---CoA ligase